MHVLLFGVFAALVCAEIPLIIVNEQLVFGQCMNTSDCFFYTEIYPSLTDNDIFCNEQTSRCQTTTGEILVPTFNALCAQLSLTTVTYPAIHYNNISDGMIQVTISAPSNFVHGVLRLFPINIFTNNASLSVPYIQQQFANAPILQYSFREIPAGTYAIQYFHETGCIAVVYPDPVKNVFDGTYMPSGGIAFTPGSNFLNMAQIVHTNRSFAFGLGIRAGFISTFPTAQMHTQPADVGKGQRVPYAHVLDVSGGVLSTYYSTALILASGVNPAITTGGITYPLGAQSIIPVINTQLEAMTLSGGVIIQFGIGYSFLGCAAANCTPYFIQDANGVYEGWRVNPIYKNISTATFMPNTTGPYDVGPMFVTLNSMFTNTQFMYQASDFLMNPALLMTAPHIIVGAQSGTNSFCLNSTSTTVNVVLDYSQEPFKVNPVGMQIWQLNMTSAGIGLVAVTSVQVIIAGSYTVTLGSTGSFCSILSGNLLDGHGYRPLLQSCFQIGRATASITQVESFYVNNFGTQNPPYAYTPYAGFGSLVSTSFYATLPALLFLPAGYTILLQLFVMSSDPTTNSQIVQYGGDVVDVFNDNRGDVPLSGYYNVTTLWAGNYTQIDMYTLNDNIYAGHDFFIERNGASSVVNTFAFTKFFIFNGTIEPGPNDYAGIPPSPDGHSLPFTDYTTFEGSTGNGNTNTSNLDIVYMCMASTFVNMLEATDLQVLISVTNAICPDQSSSMTGVGDGGFPFALNNPTYTTTSIPAGGTFPYTNPITYYFKWVSVQTQQILYAALGGYLFPAPSNAEIQLTIYDAMGNIATGFAFASSVIPVNNTIITFLPENPLCIGGIQYVQLTYTVNQPAGPGLIEFWQPLDPTARESYDPNSQFFDLPANCSLLQTMSAYDVFIQCQYNGGNVSSGLNCTGCTNLPIQYGQANGRTLLTSVDEEWWEVVVWTVTPYWNAETGRFNWCRTGLSINTEVPVPLSLTFSQPVFINPQPALNVCPNQACFSVVITPVIDQRYLSYTYSPILLSMPQLVTITPPSTYMVTFGTNYNLTVFIANNFCPVQEVYTPTGTGPIIVLVRTTRTDCNSADGSVVIYMEYNNPNLASAGTTANLCLYWPNRHDPSQQAADSVPLPFQIVVNSAVPTMLPNNNFVETQRFAGIRAGQQQFLIYDACGGVGSTSGDCTSCLDTTGFRVTNGGHSVYDAFVVDTFANPAGGLVVQRDDYTPARCCGDPYIFNFTIYDNSVSATQPYSVQFFLPFNLGVFETFATCNNNPPMPPSTPFGDFQVQWTGFNVVVPTCGVEGLGFSGNYTLIVRGCNSGCVSYYTTYIDVVNPFLITLSSAGTSCAYSTAQLLPQVIGGSPFQPYDNVSLVYMYPGSDILYFAPYQYCWKTPTNPFTYDCTFLQLNVIPGYYQFRACDRNQCCGYSNITVESAPPIDVTIVGYDKVCQTSNQSTIQLNVTGGMPPYYVIENVTTITSNTTISASFVATFNQSQCVHILDSSGCIKPTEVCFSIPEPGPVNLTIDEEDSCKNTATGSVTVTSDQPISCTWMANNVTIPSIQTCTLVNLPASSFLTVTATTIIGCVGMASLQIGLRAPIVITLIQRTATGVLGGPCIDNITATISGGTLGPPYFVSLFDDTTNATLAYNGTDYILITDVCRNFLYTIIAMEQDHMCPVVLVVNDPQFNFGGGGFGLPGLPPPNLNYFGPIPTGPQFEQAHMKWPVGIMILLVIVFIMLLVGVAFFISSQSPPTPSQLKEQQRRFKSQAPPVTKQTATSSGTPYPPPPPPERGDKGMRRVYARNAGYQRI